MGKGKWLGEGRREGGRRTGEGKWLGTEDGRRRAFPEREGPGQGGIEGRKKGRSP
jgi:hypothetical protein